MGPKKDHEDQNEYYRAVPGKPRKGTHSDPKKQIESPRKA